VETGDGVWFSKLRQLSDITYASILMRESQRIPANRYALQGLSTIAQVRFYSPMYRAICELLIFVAALGCMAAPVQLPHAAAAKLQPRCSVARAAERRDRVDILPVSGTAEVAESLCAASARVSQHG
jgi:hypothetical protein